MWQRWERINETHVISLNGEEKCCCSPLEFSCFVAWRAPCQCQSCVVVGLVVDDVVNDVTSVVTCIVRVAVSDRQVAQCVAECLQYRCVGCD